MLKQTFVTLSVTVTIRNFDLVKMTIIMTVTISYRYLSGKSSRSNFIITKILGYQVLVHSPKYFWSWTKIITKFILKMILDNLVKKRLYIKQMVAIYNKKEII